MARRRDRAVDVDGAERWLGHARAMLRYGTIHIADRETVEVLRARVEVCESAMALRRLIREQGDEFVPQMVAAAVHALDRAEGRAVA